MLACNRMSRCIVQNKYRKHTMYRIPPRMTSTLTTFDFGDHEDRKKKQQKQVFSSSVSPETLQKIDLLNNLFYDACSLTGRELFELLLEKFKDPYKVELRKMNEEYMLVIHPRTIYNNTQYIHELDEVARMINELSLESYVKRYIQRMKRMKQGITTPVFIPLESHYEK